MEYTLIFNATTADVAQGQDPATAPAYWAAWNAYIGAMFGAGIVKSGNGLQQRAAGSTHAQG